mgnify:CR=1 FL=1
MHIDVNEDLDVDVHVHGCLSTCISICMYLHMHAWVRCYPISANGVVYSIKRPIMQKMKVAASDVRRQTNAMTKHMIAAANPAQKRCRST